MTGDLRWTSTSHVEDGEPGEMFRDADGRYWAFDAAAGWLRHTGRRWQADDDPPRFLEGVRGPLTAVRSQPRSPSHAPDVMSFLERRVADVARAYRAGELTDGQAHGVLLGLVAADSGGWLWTVGPRSGTWYVLDGGSWRSADRPTIDRFVGRPDPALVARSAGVPAESLLPEAITAPWDPPRAPAPAASAPEASVRVPGGRRWVSGAATGVLRARRIAGVLSMVVGLATAGMGVARSVPGGEQPAAAAPTSTTGAPETVPPTTTAIAVPTTAAIAEPTTSLTPPTTRPPAVTTRPTDATTAPPTEPPITAAPTAPPTTSAPVETVLVPLGVQATSWLEPSARATYGPMLAFDGRNDTAWCVKGDGSGESLTIELRGVPTVTRVGLVPGYDKIDPVGRVDRWTQNRRVTALVWSFTSEASYAQEPDPDDHSLQVMALPTPEDGSRVFLTITATAGGEDTCVSEVVLVGDPGTV